MSEPTEAVVGWVPPPGLHLRRTRLSTPRELFTALADGRTIPDEDLPLARTVVRKSRATVATRFATGMAVAVVAYSASRVASDQPHQVFNGLVTLAYLGVTFLGYRRRRLSKRVAARTDVLPLD